MDEVTFEQLLSFKPVADAPCLRDLIFDHLCERYPGNEELANRLTKAYTDVLYAKFGKQ